MCIWVPFQLLAVFPRGSKLCPFPKSPLKWWVQGQSPVSLDSNHPKGANTTCAKDLKNSSRDQTRSTGRTKQSKGWVGLGQSKPKASDFGFFANVVKAPSYYEIGVIPSKTDGAIRPKTGQQGAQVPRFPAAWSSQASCSPPTGARASAAFLKSNHGHFMLWLSEFPSNS